jgi:transcription initiation factor IIE alpha subunit
VVCDKCNKEFKITAKTRKLPLGIDETYFTCPHCKTKYISYYTDESIREKQTEINKLWDKYRKLKDGKEMVKMIEKINYMEAEIKADMENLKKKMLGTQ